MMQWNKFGITPAKVRTKAGFARMDPRLSSLRGAKRRSNPGVVSGLLRPSLRCGLAMTGPFERNPLSQRQALIRLGKISSQGPRTHANGHRLRSKAMEMLALHCLRTLHSCALSKWRWVIQAQAEKGPNHAVRTHRRGMDCHQADAAQQAARHTSWEAVVVAPETNLGCSGFHVRSSRRTNSRRANRSP
jgi:hypothetical protein